METSAIWLIVLGVICVANLNLLVFTNWHWQSSRSDVESDIEQLLTASEQQANKIATLEQTISEWQRLFSSGNLITSDTKFNIKTGEYLLVGDQQLNYCLVAISIIYNDKIHTMSTIKSVVVSAVGSIHHACSEATTCYGTSRTYILLYMCNKRTGSSKIVH